MILIHDFEKDPALSFFFCSMAQIRVAVLAKDERDAASKVLMEIFKHHKDLDISMIILVENEDRKDFSSLFRVDEILRDVGLYEQSEAIAKIFREESE